MSEHQIHDVRAGQAPGFPRGVQFTPVPNPVLAGLLEQIDDIAELKVTLRVLWALHRKRDQLAFVTLEEMTSDRTVAAMLHATGGQLESVVRGALESAVERGTLLAVSADEGDVRTGTWPRYVLNTEPVRRTLERRGFDMTVAAPAAETRQSEDQPELRSGVFRAYEENIGPLTPLVADSMRAALLEHPESDIIDALRIAAESNARSWKYATAVLRRWSQEGRDGRGTHGEPERHTEASRSDEFIERYLERQRARGNR